MAIPKRRQEPSVRQSFDAVVKRRKPREAVIRVLSGQAQDDPSFALPPDITAKAMTTWLIRYASGDMHEDDSDWTIPDRAYATVLIASKLEASGVDAEAVAEAFSLRFCTYEDITLAAACVPALLLVRDPEHQMRTVVNIYSHAISDTADDISEENAASMKREILEEVALHAVRLTPEVRSQIIADIMKWAPCDDQAHVDHMAEIAETVKKSGPWSTVPARCDHP